MWSFKDKVKKFQPVSRLDKLLVEAANNPAVRGEFMRQLFHFPLYVLGSKQDENIAFEMMDSPSGKTIFIFTSLEALSYTLTRSKRGPAGYIEVKALDLFYIAKENSLNMLLNSGHDHGKFFTLEDIDQVLRSSPENKVVVPAESSLTLGQPAKGYPPGFLDTLRDFVHRNIQIRNIYLGWVISNSLQQSDGAGEYFAAIDFKTEDQPTIELLIKDMQIVMRDFLQKDESIVISPHAENWNQSSALIPLI